MYEERQCSVKSWCYTISCYTFSGSKLLYLSRLKHFSKPISWQDATLDKERQLGAAMSYSRRRCCTCCGVAFCQTFCLSNTYSVSYAWNYAMQTKKNGKLTSSVRADTSSDFLLLAVHYAYLTAPSVTRCRIFQVPRFPFYDPHHVIVAWGSVWFTVSIPGTSKSRNGRSDAFNFCFNKRMFWAQRSTLFHLLLLFHVQHGTGSPDYSSPG